MYKRVISIVLTMTMCGCATTRLPPPAPQAGSGALLLALTVRVSGLASYRADTVYFVRQCAAADDCDHKLLASNFAAAGRVYLLNAKPGHYQPVAASFGSGMPGDNSLYFAYFPASLSAASSVQVRPQGLSYAGSYLLAASMGVCPETAEQAQLAYAEMIEPGTPKCGLVKMLLHKIASGNYIFIAGNAYPVGTQTYHYRGTGFQQLAAPGDWSAITGQVRADLAGSGWEPMLIPARQ